MQQIPALLALTLAAGLATAALPQGTGAQQGAKPRPQDTEVWEPVPKKVAPGSSTASPPADALVLFDGTSLDEWVNTRDKSPAGWTLENGVMTVDKKVGNIETKRTFEDYQLHIEWRIPAHVTGKDQARGNSGLFLASTGPGDAGYEIQILDSFENTTYVNGQAGSIYKQYPPLVNASRKPGEWQSYDIVWRAPRFNSDGSVKTPARVTAFHNGVLIQNGVELQGETVYIGKPAYKAHGPSAIKLQSHNDPSEPISFRNIWIREL